MPGERTPEAEPPAQLERVLGRVVGDRPGPTLIMVGGLHGNEPSGVLGLRRVLPKLERNRHALSGELVALSGNLEALSRRHRFIQRDLNRCWTEERVSALREHSAKEVVLAPEDREQRELLAELEAALERAGGQCYVVDMHSTSGFGSPFAVLSDTLQNRDFASWLPVPLVLGLEEEIEGTLLNYLHDDGHITLGFEAGQHDDPISVEHAEAAVWICLEAAGMIDREHLEPPDELLQQLRRAGAGLPEVVEVRYRHPVEEGDGFEMADGYSNFQQVAKGEVLARDSRGPVTAPESGMILMPLYQKQGEDGFFLVRGFRPFWLRISRLLRRGRADRIVHWLPGVKRHPKEPATYIVNRRVARWFALEIFHLLGFRRHGSNGDALVISRRPDDLRRDGL